MRYLLALLMWCYCWAAKAQLHDAQWVLSTLPSALDFRNPDTLTTYSLIGAPLPMFRTSANICDENGNLLFITNGINIYDNNGDTVKNGAFIVSQNGTNDQYQNSGLNLAQAAIFIPKPGSTRYYYLIHEGRDVNGAPKKVFLTIIDKEANNGLGEVIQHHTTILDGPLLRAGGISSCKHANGRDWWVVLGVDESNTFAKFLITPDTVIGPVYQSIGEQYGGFLAIEHSQFSLNGSRYATGTLDTKITVLDFNRCTGEFSNPILIYNNRSTDPINNPFPGISGLCFSPNEKYLYAFGIYWGNQYDLWASNIQDSVEICSTQDSSNNYNINAPSLAPNGKIYVCTWSGGLPAYHVINYPDKHGDSCGFVYGGQPTLSLNSVNIPNMPNYKLGPLIGSGCDTLPPIGIKETDKQTLLNIQPNPANAYVYVEVGKAGMYTITLHDITGKQFQQTQTPQVTIFNTEQIPNGTYVITVTDTRTNKLVESKQIIVQH